MRYGKILGVLVIMVMLGAVNGNEIEGEAHGEGEVVEDGGNG